MSEDKGTLEELRRLRARIACYYHDGDPSRLQEVGFGHDAARTVARAWHHIDRCIATRIAEIEEANEADEARRHERDRLAGIEDALRQIRAQRDAGVDP